MGRGCRDKAAQLRGRGQATVFLGNDVKIAIGEEEKKGKFTRHPEPRHGSGQSRSRNGGQQRQDAHKNGVGLESDKPGQSHPLLRGNQGPESP